MTITISEDQSLLDIPLIHRFLAEDSTWAQGISLTVVEKAIRHSLCLGAYESGAQVGFARVVTDRATYAYLCDVFTLPTHRGQGISRLLMDAVLAHPDVQGLRRFNLITSTAAGLYENSDGRRCRSRNRIWSGISPTSTGGDSTCTTS